MYLAPLNYDRYFKKVFSELNIAKRFLEDFLDVEIQEIEHLEREKTISDDARFVEFDFRCKIEDRNIIIEMQQWYKPDVVQRFFLYHTLNTALQLEALPKKHILVTEEGFKEVKDYRQLLPVVTLVWMVDDNLGFEDDFVAYVPTPEEIPGLIRNGKLWQEEKIKELMQERERLLKQLENKEKDLGWLPENRLIYAFQKNIVRNKKYAKYYTWFELAQKTLEKISDKFAYAEYEQDEVLGQVVRRLKKEIERPEEIRYIQDYDEFREGVLRYEGHVFADGEKAGRAKAEAEYKPQLEERDKMIEEKERALKAEREKIVQTVRKLKEKGMDTESIADITGLPVAEVEKIT